MLFPTGFGNNREKNNFPVKRRNQSIEILINVIGTKYERVLKENINSL
jgi:hypothetical protein